MEGGKGVNCLEGIQGDLEEEKNCKISLQNRGSVIQHYYNRSRGSRWTELRSKIRNIKGKMDGSQS